MQGDWVAGCGCGVPRTVRLPQPVAAAPEEQQHPANAAPAACTPPTPPVALLLLPRRPIHEAAGAKAVPLYLAMIALHAGLGLALKLYFFSYSST